MNFDNLKKDLAFYPVDKIVFVGLGNPLRRDDAAGLIILEKISISRHFKNAHFIKAYTTPESHLEEILNYHPEIVVIIDAADWGGRDGENHGKYAFCPADQARRWTCGARARLE